MFTTDTAATPSSIRELANRREGGIEVTLLWNTRHDRLSVSVIDIRSGDLFLLEADRTCALDVFYHPYVYAVRHGVAVSSDLAAL